MDELTQDFFRITDKLLNFWAQNGCTVFQPYDVEVGAGTFHPATFFGVLGKGLWNVAYVQPSRRPQDGRYGKNPQRLQHYFQLQVILKPAPPNSIDLYIESLLYLGIDVSKRDFRLVEDNWESPTLGAWGLGWEARLDGMEITQLTFFQQMAGIDLDPISFEITYGLERIALFITRKDNLFDLQWGNITYGYFYKEREEQWSIYNFEKSDPHVLFSLFDIFEREGLRLVSDDLYIPAYDYCIKCSHIFNLLDARGVISYEKRAELISRVRNLAKLCANSYLKSKA
jgi:glycyl-tRNA synthetase alpha chain